MKYPLIGLSVILILAGCGVFDGDDDKDNTPSYSAQKYFPMKAGSSWAYKLTETDSTGTQKTPLTIINSIVGTTRQNNTTYTIIFDNEKQDSLLVRLQGNVIYALRQVGSTQGNPSDVPYIDFNVQAGKSWTIYSQTYTLQGFVISQDVKGTFIGVETVTVPKGIISGCLHYSITENTTITSDGTTNSTTFQENIWLAPDAGKVKRTKEYRKNMILRGSLTEEAVTYTIPQ